MDNQQIIDELNRRLMAVETITAGDGAHLFRNVAERTKCRDGFDVSIQAGRTCYCDPRTNRGPWLEFELGYPSAPMPGLEQWAETPNTTDTVWAYVPADAIAQLIASHGGFAEGEV